MAIKHRSRISKTLDKLGSRGGGFSSLLMRRETHRGHLSGETVLILSFEVEYRSNATRRSPLVHTHLDRNWKSVEWSNDLSRLLQVLIKSSSSFQSCIQPDIRQADDLQDGVISFPSPVIESH